MNLQRYMQLRDPDLDDQSRRDITSWARVVFDTPRRLGAAQYGVYEWTMICRVTDLHDMQSLTGMSKEEILSRCDAASVLMGRIIVPVINVPKHLRDGEKLLTDDMLSAYCKRAERIANEIPDDGPNLQHAIFMLGSYSSLARAIGVSPSAISTAIKRGRVSRSMAVAIAHATHGAVTVDMLCPDIAGTRA